MESAKRRIKEVDALYEANKTEETFEAFTSRLEHKPLLIEL